MRIRHTVVFTFFDRTSDTQINQVISLLDSLGENLVNKTGVAVSKHLPQTFKSGRGHLLQDGVFPSLAALESYADSQEHKRVVALTATVCDWVTIDTVIPEATIGG